MKNWNRIALVFILGMLIHLAHAQAPNGLNFQTIIRDNLGKPITNKNVNIRFTILKGGATGTPVFIEEHRTITNEFGLTNVLIGYGFPVQGKFNEVNWGDGSYYLKTEIDPNGGINYELASVSPFLSVPYALFSEKTKLEAGAGIQVDGNKITNTGDPDPTDDLKLGSSVGGDLIGTLPNPKVIAIQGRNIQDIAPNLGQALVWNGSQWIPGMVDIDPANDLTINSNANGDLSGTYPAPKVVKLNGFPLALTNPDSGDVMVFSQGEWKHLPFNSGPTSSIWKKSGNDIVLDDPTNIKKIFTSNAAVWTQGQLISALGTDSIIVSPNGINQSGMVGLNRIHSFSTPGTFTVFKNTDTLMAFNSVGINSYYSNLKFFNKDPALSQVGSTLDPYGIGFQRKSPDRYSYLTEHDFEIYRKSKDSPVEYDGVYLEDSTFYFYRGKNDIIAMESESQFGGEIFLFDRYGKERMSFTTKTSDQTRPSLNLLSTKGTKSVDVIELSASNNAGEMYLINGTTDELNVYAGYSNLGPNYPFLGIGDGAGAESAGMYLNSFGQGVVFGDIKSFRIQDPDEIDQEIWYACIEGPEAAAYERGTGTLSDGEVFIPFSDHFIKVANMASLTVQLTPAYADTYGIAVVEKLTTGFKVKELQGKRGNFSFDWEVKAIRKGHENYQVYHKKESLHQLRDTNTNGFSNNKRELKRYLK